MLGFQIASDFGSLGFSPLNVGSLLSWPSKDF